LVFGPYEKNGEQLDYCGGEIAVPVIVWGDLAGWSLSGSGRRIGWRGSWRFLAPPWRAAPGVADRMTAAVAAEYIVVAAEAAAARTADAVARRRAVARLRRELHRIRGRDFFTCPQGEAACRAVEHLAAADPAGVRM